MARFFIHRPVFAIVVSLVILISGFISMQALPIAQYPEITPPTVTVTTSYQGASCQVLEETVAAPIEQQVNGAEGMLYMRSVSDNTGNYQLQVTFDLSRDQDLAMVDVQNRVNQASPLLPQEVVKNGVVVKKQSTQALFYISLYSPDDSKDTLFLSNYATINIVDQIARIPGVGVVNIAAGQRDYSMRLWVRPDYLAKLGVTATDISNAIQQQNVQAAAGSIGVPPQPPGQDFQYPIVVKGRLDQPEEFENIIVRSDSNGSLLRVKDIASTELGAQNYNTIGRRDGKPALILAIYQLPGANAIDLAEKVKAKLVELGEAMPQGVAYELTYDNTKFVTESIKEVEHTLFEAIVLVLIVVFIFLGNFRATFIPMLAVPVSLVGTFAGFAAFGFSINLLTLFGLILAVGIVVDDAIVVVEAVEHHIEHGLDPLAATEKAMDEVSGPVMAIALVLCSVFVPVAFLGGITGEMYKQFGVTLAVSVVLSALVALSLTPALCRMLLRPRKPMGGPLGLFLKGFNWAFDHTTNFYMVLVHKAIRWVVITLALLGSIYYGVYFFGTHMPTGFIPPEDLGYFMINVALPPGASLDRTQKVTRVVEEAVARKAGVKNVISLIGYNILQGTTSSNMAAVVIVLDDWSKREEKSEQTFGLVPELGKELNQIPEATFQVFNPPAIPGLGTAGGVTLELEDRAGNTVDALASTAQDYVKSCMATKMFRMAYTLFIPIYPQIKVNVDRDKLETLGIPVNDAFTGMQINLGGYFVNQFNKFGRTWRVYIQSESQYRRTPEDIGKIYLRAPGDNMVPLSTVSSIQEIVGPDVILRYNLFRSAEINADPRMGVSTGQVIAEMEKLAKDLPPGFGYDWTTMAYQEKLSSGQQGMIFALGLTFVFLFLAAQYESWSIPFSVLLGIPTCVLGALIGTYVIHMDVNIYVQIGILMLVGLASKNAILIVEFAKMKYEEEGLSLVEAAAEGARLRFRPILMTSFAFILGVVPLVTAEGASAVSRRALGTAVFSGMTLAVIVGVLIIPALFVYVESITGFFSRKKGGPAKEAASGEASLPPAPTPEVAPEEAAPPAPAPEAPPAEAAPRVPPPAAPAAEEKSPLEKPPKAEEPGPPEEPPAPA